MAWMRFTEIAVAAAGVYLFAVLPHVHDFAMLVILFAAPFILVGTLMPRNCSPRDKYKRHCNFWNHYTLCRYHRCNAGV